MLVSVHLIAFLVNEYFTPKWQRHVRDITREVVDCFHDAVPVEAPSDNSFPLRIPEGFS